MRYESIEESVVCKQGKSMQGISFRGLNVDLTGKRLQNNYYNIKSMKMRLVYKVQKNMITTPHRVKLSRDKSQEA